MRANIIRRKLFFLGFALTIAASSCQNPSSWYPAGKASILSSYELTASGIKTCEVTLKILNTGQSTISNYTISLSAATDARTYYKTASDSLTILPGKNAYWLSRYPMPRSQRL